MLECRTDYPVGARQGAPVFVLLHGRGSDAHDLLGLRRGLPAGALIVAPRAPYPAADWGYGPGWAWYRYLGGTRPEEESFDRSQRALDDFMEALPELLPVAPGPVVLGGFSQGGTMSLAWVLRNPGKVPLAVNFSGFLPDHPGVRTTPETVRGTRIFWGHGTDDPAIPFAMAVEGRAALRAAGAELEARDYEMGHWIEPRELQDVVSWMQGELGQANHQPEGERCSDS